jgi:hypothetical protein
VNPDSTVVVDKAELAEAVHEEADAGSQSKYLPNAEALYFQNASKMDTAVTGSFDHMKMTER